MLNVNYSEEQANKWQLWIGQQLDFKTCTVQDVMTLVSKKVMELDRSEITALMAAEDEVLRALGVTICFTHL